MALYGASLHPYSFRARSKAERSRDLGEGYPQDVDRKPQEGFGFLVSRVRAENSGQHAIAH